MRQTRPTIAKQGNLVRSLQERVQAVAMYQLAALELQGQAA